MSPPPGLAKDVNFGAPNPEFCPNPLPKVLPPKPLPLEVPPAATNGDGAMTLALWAVVVGEGADNPLVVACPELLPAPTVELVVCPPEKGSDPKDLVIPEGEGPSVLKGDADDCKPEREAEEPKAFVGFRELESEAPWPEMDDDFDAGSELASWPKGEIIDVFLKPLLRMP